MSERSSGVRWEWRVVYRIGESPLLSVDVVALTAEAAREMVGTTVTICSVAQVRPIVDWQKPWLTIEEAAVRVGKAPRTVMRWVEQGLLAPCNGVHPIYTSRAIDRAAAASIGLDLGENGDLKMRRAA